MPLLKRVLIANRGEIAVRVIDACQALGIETVLAVSQADRETLGARRADRVVCIGPAPAAASYLNPALVCQAALSTGCDGLHPGYGFLSERQELAKMCEDNQLKFIGPGAETIRRVGDKLEARAAAAAAGVPVVPGSNLVATASEAAKIADGIGYPVMLKAAAGGGGRGVFVAHTAADIEASFERASREALAAFGDGSLYMERFIGNARHIEVQVFGDDFGNALHLGERDCSIQRRYQKVVEEGPGYVLPAGVRARLHAAAIELVQYLGYINAGTVEFLYDADREDFFFIEMNARVQVEHPVTELITGVDIVQEQLRIASGMPISLRQDEVKISGHAIECRINAEQPRDGFMPRPGRITRWSPPQGASVRLDTHCYTGYLVPPHYDSMIAKLLVHAADRASAVDAMRVALDGFEIEGIETNIDFHRFVMRHADYVEGKVNTRWLESTLLPAFQNT
jgi:acetyl-CoA carboxylase, biotin carboxylase subunit